MKLYFRGLKQQIDVKWKSSFLSVILEPKSESKKNQNEKQKATNRNKTVNGKCDLAVLVFV